MFKKLLFFILLIFSSFQLKSQDSVQNSSFAVNADMVSRYVWRGQLYSAAPNIQPYASLTKGQFTLGTWGSYALGDKYSEVDLYILWQFKRLGLTLSDYCTLSELPGETKYFDYGNRVTPHAIEGTANFQVAENFPLKITAATFFYGNDKDSTGNYYSSYLELSYPYSKAGYDFNFYIGGTPAKGLYGTKAGLVNVGLSARKIVKLSETFEMPATIQLAANPLSNSIYLIFFLTI